MGDGAYPAHSTTKYTLTNADYSSTDDSYNYHSMPLLLATMLGEEAGTSIVGLSQQLPHFIDRLIDGTVSGPLRNGEPDPDVLMVNLINKPEFFASFYDAFSRLTEGAAAGDPQLQRGLIDLLLQTARDDLGNSGGALAGDNPDAITIDIGAIAAGDGVIHGLNDLDGYLTRLAASQAPFGPAPVLPAFTSIVVQANGDTALEIAGGEAGTLFLGGRGADRFVGGGAGDIVYGGAGDDTLEGGAGDDVLLGGQGTDTLTGGLGNDYLNGGVGEDTVDYRAEGAVTITAGTTSFTASGAGGTDTLVGIEHIIGNATSTFATNATTLTTDSQGRVRIADADGSATTASWFDTLVIEGYGANAWLSGALFNRIEFGGGDDRVNGTPDGATVILGNGDDEVRNAGNGAIVDGGAGADLFGLANNVMIVGADAQDHLSLGGSILTGGSRWVRSESPWAYGDGVRYGKNMMGDLVVRDMAGRQMFVGDYVGGPGASYQSAGIYIYAHDAHAWHFMDPDAPNWTTSLDNQMKLVESILKSELGVDGAKEVLIDGVDPLVIDLDGDGIELLARAPNSPLFDLDSDGFAEHTGWVGRDDGLLVQDLGGDGVIGNGRELFGDVRVSGFAELARLDDNLDGMVDATDSGWATLKVWRDANSNARSEAGELIGLEEAGIGAINLENTEPDRAVFLSGHQVAATGTFTRSSDGSQGGIADIWLKVDNLRTSFLGDTSISAEAATLPDIKGYGTLTDLRVAMTLDPALVEVARTTLPSLDQISLTAAAGVLGLPADWIATDVWFRANMSQTVPTDGTAIPDHDATEKEFQFLLAA